MCIRQWMQMLRCCIQTSWIERYDALQGAAGGCGGCVCSKADVIVEGDYHTPAQEHAFLQPEAGVSYIDDEGRVTVVVAGQWVHEEQEEIAHALGIPEDQVRVIYPAIGGAFGGREDMSVQIVLGIGFLAAAPTRD
jgi:CO/xanthine dehydrogenase Mo-binding subunit